MKFDEQTKACFNTSWKKRLIKFKVLWDKYAQSLALLRKNEDLSDLTFDKIIATMSSLPTYT